MIHYAASLLLVRVVLATTNRTFDECISYCVDWKMTNYWTHYTHYCENSSVSSCFDELTRNISVNTLKTLTVDDSSVQWVEIKYPLVDGATHYLLKYSIYDPLSKFTPITSYKMVLCEGKFKNIFMYKDSFIVKVPKCKEMNITVWPVTDQGIGESAFSHFKPNDFPCQVDTKGHLCDTLSVNQVKVAFHDVEPTCNADQLDLQAEFDIGDIGDYIFQYENQGGSIPRCSVFRRISVYACGCFADLEPKLSEFRNKKRQRIEAKNKRFSNLSESGACDRSGRFCLDPMANYIYCSTLASNASCTTIYNREIPINEASSTTRKHMKMVMLELNYDWAYQLIYVLRFTVKNQDTPPNTNYIKWMARLETTYEYYLRTYADPEDCNTSKQSMYDTTESNLVTVISIGFGAVILVILVVFGTGMVVYKRRSRKKQSRKKRFNESIELREERYHDMIRCPSDDDIFEIDCERVIIFKDQVLGQGAFGKVYKGKIKGLAMTSFHAASKLTDDQELAENMLVAVKQCYEFADATTKREFIREIEIMKELYQHDTLVNILHCITQYPHKPFSLILEYCEHGDLLKFLQNSKVYLEKLKTDEPDNEKIILFDDVAQITFEVADGMTYLAEKGYVHRDLAARNIMVTKGKHVKIGDFGLCRSVVSQDDVYTTKGGKLPIKWMAIESLYDYQFSSKSDVWSYGVLLYEVTTLGLQPYADVVPQDGDFRRAMIAHLRSGARLEQPPSCPDEIYAIMKQTWAEKPEHRASFAEIRETARKLVESLHDLDGGVYGDRYVGVEVNRCDKSDGEE